ncbi:MAG TPA: TonB-dependent receptor [Anaeromyxobacteraceae bacterium]|nr:TonB-dependent receptor [Anaeromyxobacteraceae bacterium]
MTTVPLRGALAALVVSLARVAAAQGGEESPVHLPEVVVPLSRLQAAGDATASATVVEAERFQGEAKGVAELVATAPGVAVHEYGGLGHLATVSIRGSSADAVTVLLDGLPLNTAFGGGVDLSTIPRHWIDRIEVVRGAEGARYGAGAMGGVVNVVTRRAAAGAWSAQAAYGSFGTFSLAGDHAAGGQGWTALAAGSLDATRGDFPYLHDPTPSASGNPLEPRLRENNAARVGGLLLKGDFPGLGGRFDALVQISSARRELPGWPADLTPADRQDETRALVAVRHARWLARDLTFSARLSARIDRLDARLEAAGGEIDQRDGAASARAEAGWLHGPGLLSAGASVEGERVAAAGLGGARSRVELAAWLAEDLSLVPGRFRLAPALRAERVGGFDGLSGKLGATLGLGGPFSARASVGHTFRAPSVAELYLEQGGLEPNPALRPESAWSGDASIAAEGPLGLASAGAFASAYRDLIVYESATQRRLKPFNAAKAAMRGFELEAASAPIHPVLGLSAAVAYTFLRSETLRGAEAVLGRDLPRRPRHRLYARLGLGEEAVGAHLEAHWVSRQWQDSRNLVPIPEAWLFSAGGFVRLLARPDLRLSLEVKNLLDRRTLEDGFGNPLPSRMVMVTARIAPEGRTP